MRVEGQLGVGAGDGRRRRRRRVCQARRGAVQVNRRHARGHPHAFTAHLVRIWCIAARPVASRGVQTEKGRSWRWKEGQWSG